MYSYLGDFVYRYGRCNRRVPVGLRGFAIPSPYLLLASASFTTPSMLPLLGYCSYVIQAAFCPGLSLYWTLGPDPCFSQNFKHKFIFFFSFWISGVFPHTKFFTFSFLSKSFNFLVLTHGVTYKYQWLILTFRNKFD